MLLRIYLLFGDRSECASGSVQDGCIVLCGALDYGSGERIQAKSWRGPYLQRAEVDWALWYPDDVFEGDFE